MAWEYETFGPDGQCKLFGVNIFDYDWQTTGKRVKVKDPIYHQDHTFEVWQVEIDGQIHRFAAGEFSNCPTVYGDSIWKRTDERIEMNTKAGNIFKQTENYGTLKTIYRW